MRLKDHRPRLRLLGDVMGLSPLPQRLKEAKTAIRGEVDIPPSLYGLSSFKQLYPRISPKLWRGKFYIPKTVIISNLFNHTQTPIELGWSVRKTQTLDFRGGQLTYDSHNGTDFAIPVGSTVTAAAPGRVIAVQNEFNRGGLKIFIDHGNGLITSSGHLARSMVQTGQLVHRGQPIALSGYSGIDGFITFPFGIPHVHFNVWLNGEPVDPFPFKQENAIWKAGRLPQPEHNTSEKTALAEFIEANTTAAINACKNEQVRNQLLAYQTLYERATNTIIKMNYYPTRFTERHTLYAQSFTRIPYLSLPFPEQEFNRVVFLDEL